MPSHYCPPSTWWAQALGKEEGMAGVRHGDGLPSILMFTETTCRYNSAHLTLLTGARAICAVGKRSRLLRYAYLSLAWGALAAPHSQGVRHGLHTRVIAAEPAGTKLRWPSSVRRAKAKTGCVLFHWSPPIMSDTGRLPMRPKLSC